MNTLELARDIVHVLEERKGEDILLLDIHEVASFTDYFVICSGTSDRMLASLADAAMEHAKATYGLNSRSEGSATGGWLLVDLGDVIVHLFSIDQREYYQLEQLWENGRRLLHMQ